MLFSKLYALRPRVTSIGVAITFQGDNLMGLIVTPTLKAEVAEKAPHLGAPFMLTATPEELDAGFAEQFDAFDVVHVNLQQQVTAQIKALTDAAAAKKTTKVSGTAGPKTSSSGDLNAMLEGGEDVGESESESDTVGSESKPVPVPEQSGLMTASDLFA